MDASSCDGMSIKKEVSFTALVEEKGDIFRGLSVFSSGLTVVRLWGRQNNSFTANTRLTNDVGKLHNTMAVNLPTKFLDGPCSSAIYVNAVKAAEQKFNTGFL